MYSRERNMPPMEKVAANVGLDVGVCFRCGRFRRTERAHIIDRFTFPEDAPVEVVDGLGNLLPLCKPCHAMQPLFQPGEEEIAWAWFTLDRLKYVLLRCMSNPKISRDFLQLDELQQLEVAMRIAQDPEALDWPERRAS